MAAIIIIPILVVTVVAISSYLVYQLFLRDLLSKRSISQTLEKYNIDKTPSQIIKEYYENKGEPLSNHEIQKLFVWHFHLVDFVLSIGTIHF